jgi:hypothetical protein
MKHNSTLSLLLRPEYAPLDTGTTVVAFIPIHFDHVIGMSNKVRSVILLHELYIVTATFTTTTNRKNVLVGIVNGEMYKPMLISQPKSFRRFLQTYVTGRTLGHLLIRHVIGVEAYFKWIVASFVFCSAKTVRQCKRPRISQYFKHLLCRKHPLESTQRLPHRNNLRRCWDFTLRHPRVILRQPGLKFLISRLTLHLLFSSSP